MQVAGSIPVRSAIAIYWYDRMDTLDSHSNWVRHLLFQKTLDGKAP